MNSSLPRNLNSAKTAKWRNELQSKYPNLRLFVSELNFRKENERGPVWRYQLE